MKAISMVMLVRDRMRLTRQALDSLLRNSQDHGNQLNLLIVDDASQRITRQWLADWIGCHDAQLVRHDTSRGTGWARNIGIAAARELFGTDNLLYLSDNDVFFMPGWDGALLTMHSLFGSLFKIIGAGCHPFLQPSATSPENSTGHCMTTRDAISGYSWLLDWDTWDHFGPLDAHALGVRQSEDWAMCRKVVDAGYFVGSIVPEMVIHTGIVDTFGEHPPGWEIMRDSRDQRLKGIIYE